MNARDQIQTSKVKIVEFGRVDMVSQNIIDVGSGNYSL
jgi:hypothetical protein